MGIPFKDIVVKREIDFPELKDKKLAFDGNNVLYQFLSAIRGPDGRPLTNSEGMFSDDERADSTQEAPNAMII